MSRYVLARLTLLLPVVLGITMVSFVVISVIPGDVVDVIVGFQPDIPAEQLEQMRSELGLDRPLPLRYLSWLGGVLQGDFGTSLSLNVEILPEILRRLPTTVELAVLSVVFGLALGAPLGTLAAIRGGAWDWATRVMVTLGTAIPSFVTATLLLLFVAPHTPWIPIFSYVPFTEDPIRHLLGMVFPVVALGIAMAVGIAENARSAVLDVMGQEYVTTAYAKGLRGRTVIWRHVLKNASIPIISVLGLQIASLLSGVVIIESIFSLPGLGKLMVTGVSHRDYPLVQGVLLFTAMATVIVNLITDLMYAFADPRIGYD